MPLRPSVKHARARQIVQMQLANVPRKDIAAAFGIKERWVREITRWAEKEGIVAELARQQEELLARTLLPKVGKAYETVLDADIATLRGSERAHSLKLEAARDIAKGLGVFKQHKAPTVTTNQNLGFEDYLKLRETRLAATVVEPPALEVGEEDVHAENEALPA